MEIADKLKYQKYRETGAAVESPQSFMINLGLPIILFASVGAVTWAIRGTAGWGGIGGTILPGLTWGILWYYLSYRKGIDSRPLILWLGLGLAVGGELGYGQYISWIMGRFQVSDEIPFIEINPLQGYLWLFICGIGWVGLGSILIGWVLHRKTPVLNWVLRLSIPFVFVGTGWVLIKQFPALIYPHYSPGLYAPEYCSHCERTMYTNSQNFLVFLWWLGAIVTAIIQKDKHTLLTGLVLGIGFGISFAVSAAWCLGYDYAPKYIDWWKMWEMFSGLFLGTLYAITWYRVNKDIDKRHDPKGNPIQTSVKIIELTPVRELIRNFSLLAAVTTLLMMLIHGASYSIGGFLGLYDVNIVTDQYAWPPERITVFIPFAIFILAYALYKIRQFIRQFMTGDVKTSRVINLHEKVSGLILVIGAVGAVTIWPQKIGVIYAVWLCFAIWSINRINIHYNRINFRQ